MSAEAVELLQGVEEAAVVRPGDTLVLRLGERVSPEQFARFRDGALPALKERLPDVELLIVGGVEQMLVYRPSEGDGP
ncbi:hypothetical protein AB0O28_18825 [Microbispora sp. NPDC088329]|uniref:hypothetical protein n=1 Tax=Microbispora sp. NPDC088329 TaxID=3154869 RepID=UPI003441C79F